jgi:outer membrane cobalamin receptor
LRGAASDLYGGGALGGVIAIERRRTNAPFALSLETSLGSQATPEGSVWFGGRRGRWGASVAAEAFRTRGYIPVIETERGRVDTRSASRRVSGEITLEHFFSAAATNTNRLFLRTATYREDRDNGTLFQTNRTGIRSFNLGADGSTQAFDSYALRIYGGTQTYDQTFRQSRSTATRNAHAPPTCAGASGGRKRTRIARRCRAPTH